METGGGRPYKLFVREDVVGRMSDEDLAGFMGHELGHRSGLSNSDCAGTIMQGHLQEHSDGSLTVAQTSVTAQDVFMARVAHDPNTRALCSDNDPKHNYSDSDDDASGSCHDDDGDGVMDCEGDCDDTPEPEALRSPSMPESCSDTIDNNCNGTVNDGCDGGIMCDPPCERPMVCYEGLCGYTPILMTVALKS